MWKILHQPGGNILPGCYGFADSGRRNVDHFCIQKDDFICRVFFKQVYPECFQVESCAWEDSDSVFFEDACVAFPSADIPEAVSAHYKGEIVVRFAFAQCVQGADGVVRLRHCQLDVVDLYDLSPLGNRVYRLPGFLPLVVSPPSRHSLAVVTPAYVAAGGHGLSTSVPQWTEMAGDSGEGGVVALPGGIAANRVLQRILGRNNKIYHVKIGLSNKMLDNREMADM